MNTKKVISLTYSKNKITRFSQHSKPMTVEYICSYGTYCTVCSYICFNSRCFKQWL